MSPTGFRAVPRSGIGVAESADAPPAVGRSPLGDGGDGGEVGVETALTYAATPSPTTTPGLGDRRDDAKSGGKVCIKDSSAITPTPGTDRPSTQPQLADVPAPTRRERSVGGTPVRWRGPARHLGVCPQDGQCGRPPPRDGGNCRPCQTGTPGQMRPPGLGGSMRALQGPACAVQPLRLGETMRNATR